MQNSIKISVIRGAGLSFPIACLLFLFTGQPIVFVVILAGALIGFGIGEVLVRNPAAADKIQAAINPSKKMPDRQSVLANYLLHPNLFIRLVCLALFGGSLLLITWFIGYYLLSEGIFRGGAQAQMVRGSLNSLSVTVFEEWRKIFAANMMPVMIILGGSLLIRINRVPFGYWVVLFNTAGYGLFIGTNSFAIPMAARMAPSFAILERSGPYEMLALVIIASASFGWSFFEIRQLFRTNPERVFPRPKITGFEIAVLLLGIGILAAANWREAAMVISAVLSN
jgi:hypothetical protein